MRSSRLSSQPTRAWILAARPATLSAALVPVAVGTACALASGGFRAAPAAAALLGAMLIQIGTNFANDVFDYEKGADTAARLGPVRAAQAGLLSPAALRRAMIVSFALATLCGLYLALDAGWPVVVIGIASIAAGIGYTGGPYPLGYHGLGDLFVLLFFGLVAVCGTAFVQVGAVPPLALWAALPVGCLATAILVVNNLRDADTDALAGKRTLAVRLGRRAARAEYVALVALSFAVPPALLASELAGRWILLPLASAPLALPPLRAVLAPVDGPRLNRALAATARLLLVHGLLLALGIALGTP
jgi:1,4-dihydroxy-2-naphthoate octaprenyltransferase